MLTAPYSILSILSLRWGAVGGSVVSPLSETVISLYPSGHHPKDRLQTPLWSESLHINHREYQCSLYDDPRSSVARELAVNLSPLNGECFKSADDNILYCINDRVEIGGKKFFHLSDHPAPGYDVEGQVFTDSSERVGAVLTCRHKHRPLSENRGKVKKICRIGDPVPSMTEAVILQTFSANQSANILSTRDSSPASEPRRVSLASIGCDSDGSLRDHADFAIDKTSTLPDGVVHIEASSWLCGSDPASSQPLSHVEGGCFSGMFLHRMVEYCHGADIPFRFIQDGPRLNHPWPTSIPVRAAGRWEYNSREKSLSAHFESSESCGPLQPFLTEDFVVKIPATKFSVPAVGGSFSVLRFPGTNKSSVSGVLVYDSEQPYACTEEAFASSLLPRDGRPWIALVARNKCMFQEKCLMAQRKGAAAIIIVNSAKRPMIPAMASIPGMAMLDIPAVLVDSDGKRLVEMVGKIAVIRAASMPGNAPPSEGERMKFRVNFECSEFTQPIGSVEAGRFAQACNVGDQVMVNREGEQMEFAGKIVERLNSDFFKVQLLGDVSWATEVVRGSNMHKNSVNPCTAQLGTLVTHIGRTDTCELSITLHSSFLCRDTRFVNPVTEHNSVICESKLV